MARRPDDERPKIEHGTQEAAVRRDGSHAVPGRPGGDALSVENAGSRTEAGPPHGGAAVTSQHVRRAREGDAASLGWLVERLSPLLHIEADYRLPAALRYLYDPKDLVDDVWLATLPRIGDLGDRDGRWTPVLLRYMATTLLRRVNKLRRKHLQGKPAQQALPATSESGPRGGTLAATITGALTHAARSEGAQMLRRAIDELEERDREILILRGIEQLSNQAAAEVLGETPGAVAMRYHRALLKVRARLPGSVLDELEEGT